MTQHDERLSAFVDGELEQAESDQLISEMLNNDELRSRWLRYQRAGSVLRHETGVSLSTDLLAGIHARLEDEPTILAPRKKRHTMSATFKQVAGMAIAATIAAVSVIMIQPTEKAFGPASNQVAANTPAPVASQQEWLRVNSANWSDDRPAVVSKLNSYLVNHNGYSTAIRGTLPYVPIVTAGNGALAAETNGEAPAIEYKPSGDNASR
jgi:sigma-E factor negative regulatory protein RseA